MIERCLGVGASLSRRHAARVRCTERSSGGTGRRRVDGRSGGWLLRLSGPGFERSDEVEASTEAQSPLTCGFRTAPAHATVTTDLKLLPANRGERLSC